jgi:hypothetical protein
MYLGYPNTPFLSCRPPLRYGLLARDRRLELGHCKRRTGVEPATSSLGSAPEDILKQADLEDFYW